MKKISEEQIKAILELLVKYNVGIQEYSAASKLLKELPLVETETKQ